MVKFLSLVTLALFSSLATASDDVVFRPRHPNAARVAARRQAEAHHAALVAEREFTPSASPRKRSSGRCKARTTTTSSVFYTTMTSSKKPETTSKVQAPVNPGGDPTTSTSSSHHATTTTTKEVVEQTTSTKPTTTKKAEVKTTSTTKKAAAEPTTTSSGGSGTVHHGDGTYYGVGLGACGITNTDSDMICAVSQLLYDNYPGATANPNNNPVCGKYITASYGGKSVRVKVVDRCVGCAVDDLDFSPAAFSQIADQSLGRISITWQWD